MQDGTRDAAPAQVQRTALTALFAGAVAIAFAPIFVRLSELGPTATAFWRPLLALPFLWVWLTISARHAAGPRRTTSGRDVALMAAAGLAFGGDLAVWHWSIQMTSVANSTLLANFAPIFVVPAAWFLFGERFSPAFLVGLALSILGAGLLMGGSLSFGIDHVIGDLLGILTAAFYAAYILVVSRLRATLSTARIVTWSAAVTALVLLPVALLSGEAMVPTTLRGWAVLLGLALVSHAGGQSLIAYALAHLPTSFSSVALLLQPATAALLGWAILGEPLGLLQSLGGAVVLAGIVVARRASPG